MVKSHIFGKLYKFMTYPPVSCFCSIYGKVHCLPELIFSFLNQNYKGEKELVVLNDLNQQEIVFDHPEVKIINLKDRITPLGAKFNKNIEYCKHNIVSVFEVDDIYLSNHLTYAIENIKNDIYHSNIAAVWTGQDTPLHYTSNYFHATHVFTKNLFYKTGGYSIEIDNTSLDIDLMSKFKKILGTTYSISPPKYDITYIYRWGVGGYHTSGWGNVPNVSHLAENSISSRITDGVEPTGIINISPRWNENYETRIKNEIFTY